MCRQPMGLRNSVYIAQKAVLLTYSNENLDIFLEEKKIIKGTKDFPFSDISEFLLCYIDDLLVYGPKGIENAGEVHLLLIEFLLFCTIKLGFKMSKSKVQLFTTSFKFLGHHFMTEKKLYKYTTR